MKKEKLFNLLFALLILTAGFNFASCSDDDDNAPEIVNPPAEEEGGGEQDDQPNPAGDNFYQYVNGEWLKDAAPTDEDLGHNTEVNEKLTAKIAETAATMDDLKAVAESFKRLKNGDKKANTDRLAAIIKDMQDRMTSKNEAYKVFGEAIAQGLFDRTIKLYLIEYEGKIHYTLGPGTDYEDQEEGEEEYRPFKRYMSNNYVRPTALSRSVDDVLNGLATGIGLDENYFLVDENELGEFIKLLNKSSLKELKEVLQSMAEAEILPACGDKYAQELTGIDKAESYLFGYQLDKMFAYSLSYHFAKKFISDDLKKKHEAYGEELRKAFTKRIENNSWLSAKSKQEALNKLQKMYFYFGSPDEWREEGFCTPSHDLLVDNMIEMKKSRTAMIKAMLGKDKRTESMTMLMFMPGGMVLTEYNAFYAPFTNSLHILPCFMIEPEYSETMNKGQLYALLQVIGHEMTHGYDLEGSKYDAEGMEKDWWTAEDRSKFEKLNDDLIKQISTFEIAPGIKTDGKRTITEDVADLGGMHIALDALNEHLKKNGVTGDKLKEEQKNFFEHIAERYRTAYCQEGLQSISVDEHSAAHIRVNGIVQHMDAWYDLYKVTEKDALYLPKEKRVTIW